MPKWKRLVRVFMRYVLPLVVIFAVGMHFYNILRDPKLHEVHYAFRVQWLIPAALLYLVAHTIWATFWVLLLRNQGFHASYPTGWRAYFISQYGKYLPGKVWVILIRIVMLGATRKDKTIVGVTATFETLTSMAAGAMVGAFLLPMLKIDLTSIKGFSALNYILLVVALVPIGLGLLHRLSVQVARIKRGPNAEHIPHLGILLLVRGLAQAAVGYFLLGLSLWMTMQAILPQAGSFDWDTLLRLTAISSIAYIIGFIAFFLPGGVGAREYVLAALLTVELKAAGVEVGIAQGLAVVITLILRLIWTIAEILVAVLLYKFIPASHRPVLIPAKELAE
ncbi:MAG: flippase-like domain-containing protein [Planctomycetes bacterium]|nr:flippase-like domain-containing protein [Planctomycetota bacterium]